MRTLTYRDSVPDGGAIAGPLQRDLARLRLPNRPACKSRSHCGNQMRGNSAPDSSGANSYIHATVENSGRTDHQLQRGKVAQWNQTFRRLVLRALRVLRGFKK